MGIFLDIIVAIGQIQQLISELNEILANDVVDEGGIWKTKLGSQSLQLFEFLPRAIQAQLLLERDPHGNVQVILLFFELLLYFRFKHENDGNSCYKLLISI